MLKDVYGRRVCRRMMLAKSRHWIFGSMSGTNADTALREYFEITHDYPLAAAKAFATLHPDSPFSFVYVSGEGATQTPGIFTPIYGRVKGQIESALFDFCKQNPMFKVFNVRPAGVDWRGHEEIQRFMPKQATYKLMLLPPIALLAKGFTTPTPALGRILTELAMSRGEPVEGDDVGMEGRLVPNAAIRRMAGLR